MRREWTEDEEEYLYRCYAKKSAKVLAKKLNRTETSVKRKAQRMGLNTYVCEYMRAKSLAKCFDSDVLVVHRWRNKFGLPMKKEKHGNLVMYRIDTKDFWKWAKDNKEVIPWFKYERYSILPEPSWVSSAIQDSMVYKNHRADISKEDISRVKSLLNQGYSYKEIALKICRSYDSVKHIAYSNNI